MLSVVIFCVVCGLSWSWCRNKRYTEPPCYPGAWPIVGHVPMLIGDTCHLWKAINDFANQSNEMGGVGIVKLGPKAIYTITDPEDCYTVATTCMERDPIYDFARLWLGDGLITARYSKWKIHRKLLNPAFSQSLLDTFMDIFNSQASNLVKEFEKEEGRRPFDHWIYTKTNGLETISMTSLGVDSTDSSLNSDYFKANEILFSMFTERLVKFWWHSPYTFAWSKLKKKQDACVKVLHDVSNTILQNKKSRFNGNTPTETNITEAKCKPFIDLLLELSVAKGAFNDHEIREHVDTLLIAGHDTSATVITYAMILLGSHAEAQEKVFAEIQEVLGEDRDVEKTDLSKLVYLEAVLKESMRLYPFAPMVARVTNRDVKLRNCTIPAGRTCALFIFALHKHPVWGPDAHEFHPERWLEPGRLPDNPNVYAPFSLGKRNCIGKVYAMMSMKTTLVHVVRRYRITSDITKLRLKFDIFLKPDSGYYISIDKRS